MLELRCAVSTSDELLVGDCAFIGRSGSYDFGLCIKKTAAWDAWMCAIVLNGFGLRWFGVVSDL